MGSLTACEGGTLTITHSFPTPTDVALVEVPQSESVELNAVSTLHKTGSEEATPLPTTTVTTAYSPVIVQIVEIKPPTPIPVQS